MFELNDYQKLMHDLLLEYACTAFVIRGGKHASFKTAKDYTESLERYLPKEAKTRFHIVFPETAYDVLDVNRLQEIQDIINANPEWKLYDRKSHGSTFRRGLQCLIELKKDKMFLKKRGINEELLYSIYHNSSWPVTDIKEGRPYISHSIAYERDPKLRAMCINHYGCKCYICGFDFKEHYGELGNNFIEVHHLTPLSELKKEHVTSPVEGMIPLCSNCHSMVHRTNPPVEVEKLKAIFK